MIVFIRFWLCWTVFFCFYLFRPFFLYFICFWFIWLFWTDLTAFDYFWSFLTIIDGFCLSLFISDSFFNVSDRFGLFFGRVCLFSVVYIDFWLTLTACNLFCSLSLFWSKHGMKGRSALHFLKVFYRKLVLNLEIRTAIPLKFSQNGSKNAITVNNGKKRPKKPKTVQNITVL